IVNGSSPELGEMRQGGRNDEFQLQPRRKTRRRCRPNTNGISSAVTDEQIHGHLCYSNNGVHGFIEAFGVRVRLRVRVRASVIWARVEYRVV
ncbi:hypothetical protein PIB30_077271, partial [Stylosanthes scabra]|nr:hypothetical protein [Stylosanthes scabra]